MDSFNLLEHQFQRGATLIEASAGTGKTFSIAMMVLRMVAEQNIPIEQILVVTFTKAATEELRERVRSRLAQARALLSGEDTHTESDPLLRQWCTQVDPKHAHPRLVAALADIDQANIFTIHAFCQRVLQDYPLESGQAFSLELTNDLNALKSRVLQDFWRKHLYERPANEVKLWLSCFASPNDLSPILGVVTSPDTQVEPAGDDLDSYLPQLAAELSPLTQSATELTQATGQLKISIYQALLKAYFTQLNQQLSAQQQMSFDRLILNLANALKSEHQRNYLVTQVGKQYQAILIDEFQDTDADQWHIFSTLFNQQQHYLYLIGDPKQAIYKFRGADIYAYLTAAAACDYRYTLDINYRSLPNMVQAVNDVFSNAPNADPFRMAGALTFHPTRPAKTAQDPSAALIWWQMPAPNKTEENSRAKGKWKVDTAKERIQQAIIGEISQQLAQGAQPKDFAILVRSHDTAHHYQQALTQLAIPCVVNSRTSVFTSPEARALRYVLRALAEPSNVNLAKQALSISWFGQDACDLYAHLNSSAFENWLDDLFECHQRWQNKGVMAAVFALLDKYAVKETLATYPDGERRLTNLLHLIELIQGAALTAHLSIRKTLLFLERQIANPSPNDDAILRLETDDTAVQIVTMHAAKGLQYPIVFCPELYLKSDLKRGQIIRVHEQGNIVVDLGSALLEQRTAQALAEVQAEDLRLTYVTLTRAIRKTYLVYGDHLPGFSESAIHYLLQGKPPAEHTYYDHKAHADLPLPSYPSLTRYQAHHPTQVQAAQSFTRPYIDNRYRLFSFSGLNKQHNSTETPLDKAEETEIPEPEFEGLLHKQDKPLLPKGADFGNLVHDLLEQSDFAQLAQAGVDASLRDSLTSKYGLTWRAQDRTEEAQQADFDAMIKRVVTTPLDANDPQFTLAKLSPDKLLKEMGFYYAVTATNTKHINVLLTASNIPFSPISDRAIAGHLNGFIDLIAEYDGKFYVMDYKTNFLGNLPEHYTQAAMTEEMTLHGYGLQVMLYSVAVDQYLRCRLPNYDYEQHFGGVRYLFVRGMDGCSADQGVYQIKPDLTLIQALSACLKKP